LETASSDELAAAATALDRLVRRGDLPRLAFDGDFFAGDFFAGDFFAGDFFAGDFLAGDFLAGDFLAGDLERPRAVGFAGSSCSSSLSLSFAFLRDTFGPADLVLTLFFLLDTAGVVVLERVELRIGVRRADNCDATCPLFVCRAKTIVNNNLKR
jgi:hypothetical protein